MLVPIILVSLAALGLLCVGMIVVVFFLFVRAARSETASSEMRPFFIWLAQPFLSLGMTGVSMAGWLEEKSRSILHRSSSITTHEEAGQQVSGGDVLLRLTHLPIGAVLLAGELALNRLRFGWFYNLVLSKAPPGILDWLQGMVGTLLPVVWALLLVEAVGLLGIGAGLFPNLHTPKRWPHRLCVGIIAFVGLVASLVVNYSLYAQSQCQVQPDVIGIACTFDATIFQLTGGLFGVLQGGGAFLSVMGIATGLTVVLSFVCLVLSVLIALASSGLILAGKSLQSTADCNIRPARIVPVPLFPVNQSLPPSTEVKELPAGSLLQLPPAGAEQSQEEEELMADLQNRVSAVYYVGQSGERYAPISITALKNSGAIRTIRCACYINLDHPDAGKPHPALAGVIDVTPYEQITRAVATGKKGQATCEKVLETAFRNVVDAFDRLPVAEGYHVIHTDAELLPALAAKLPGLKRRLPNHVFVLDISLSDHTLTGMTNQLRRSAEPSALFQHVQALFRDEIIQNTFLTHDRSQLALRFGVKVQDTFKAKSLAGLMDCHRHGQYNGTFGSTLAMLANQSHVSTFSFASGYVSEGDATVGQRVYNAWHKNKRQLGKGNLLECIRETEVLLEQAIQTDDAKAITSLGTPASPAIYLILEPFPRDDERFDAYRNAIQTTVANLDPRVHLIVVRGAGTPDPEGKIGTYIQCSALHPLLFSVADKEDQAAKAAQPKPLDEERPLPVPLQVNGTKQTGKVRS